MKEAKNDLLTLLAGLAMLIAGLFILSQKVHVSTAYYSLLGFRMSAGLIMVPFICGVIWLFASGGKLGAKILTGLGVAFIVMSIILSVSIHLSTMTLFDWIILLILIFGGIGLVIRALFSNDSSKGPTSQVSNPINENDKGKSIDEELERLKDELK